MGDEREQEEAAYDEAAQEHDPSMTKPTSVEGESIEAAKASEKPDIEPPAEDVRFYGHQHTIRTALSVLAGCEADDGERPDVRPALEALDAICAARLRLQRQRNEGRQLVEDMDLRMPEGATEDEDGWITSYHIPVGPWHRLLAWARQGGM